jgi:hypothetical protein
VRSKLLVGERPGLALAARELRDRGISVDVKHKLADVHASGPIPGLIGARSHKLQIAGLDAD